MTNRSTIPTPELDKQRAAREGGSSQEIGAFLEWLGEQGYAICEDISDGYADWCPTARSMSQLLADYFEIDLEKLESERRALLEEMRS